MSITSYNHNVLGEVTLSQSSRARRIMISVRTTGEVRLSFPYGVARQQALEFLEVKTEWILAAKERVAAYVARLPELDQARVEELRSLAEADLPSRMQRLSQQTGLGYTKMTIRAARTKWGSCTSRNTISLSLFLMLLPEYLRDYVILHELCHTVHHDHSPRFHALADRLMGGQEKALSKELRAFAIRA